MLVILGLIFYYLKFCNLFPSVYINWPGNFFRIRSAFAFGAKRLARLLDCPNEDLYYEVNQFFMNTWDRHGSGVRPDAPRNDLWRLRLSNRDHQHEPENLHNNSGLGG